MLRSVRFALSSPRRRRRRRRRHFLLPAARLIALIPEGSRIRTCAPLSKRETPTCEQRAACRATDARFLRRPTPWYLHLSHCPLPTRIYPRPTRSQKKERERKKRKSFFRRRQNSIHIYPSFPLPRPFTTFHSLFLALSQSPFLFISVLLHERIAGPNI